MACSSLRGRLFQRKTGDLLILLARALSLSCAPTGATRAMADAPLAQAQGQAPNVPSEQPEQPRSAPVGAFAAAAARVDLTRDLGSDASLPLPRVKRVLAAPSLQACDPHLCGVNNEGAFVIGKAAVRGGGRQAAGRARFRTWFAWLAA